MPSDHIHQENLAVDFDGVLHSYRTPWIDSITIPDPPVPGAIEWLEMITLYYEIYINSTRNTDQGADLAIRAWLRNHGLSDRAMKHIHIAYGKPKALLYIDDRAYHFKGNFPEVAFIKAFKPWNKTFPK